MSGSIMKRIILVLSVIVLTAGFHHRGRIYGGQDAISGQFPYMVAINDGENFQYCGGVIIAPSWILTAAQCLYYFTPEATVYVGSHINEINGTPFQITDTFAHEDFDETSLKNDIGLIRLSTDLVFSDTVQAIQFSELVEANATCTFLGWGSSEGEVSMEILQYVEVTAIEMELCQTFLNRGFYLGPEQICSLAPRGKGSCFGDEGGPLVCDGKLAGVFSYNFVFDCGLESPAAYSSISAYLNWILTIIQL